MIKSITVTNHLGESIELELAAPEKSGFVVQWVDGLGPCKADINQTQVATGDGGLYTGARVNSRNIVLTLKFLWKPTIEDVRQKSYKYFPLKKRITIKVETDNRTAETYGYVESNTPTIFSKDEGCQISIVCPDAYFHGFKKTTVFSGLESMFEFPFSNESLTEDLIVMANIKTTTSEHIFYEGDSDAGMKFNIHALGDVDTLTIFNTETREQMKININLVAGDDLIISTVKGNKFATLLRDGEYINVLNIIDRDMDWFQLRKGENIFAYTAVTGVEKLEFNIENHILYEGV